MNNLLNTLGMILDEKRLKEQTKRNLAMIGERFNDNK